MVAHRFLRRRHERRVKRGAGFLDHQAGDPRFFVLFVDGVAGGQRARRPLMRCSRKGTTSSGRSEPWTTIRCPAKAEQEFGRVGLADEKRALKAYPREHDRQRVPRPKGDADRALAVAIRGFDAVEFSGSRALRTAIWSLSGMVIAG